MRIKRKVNLLIILTVALLLAGFLFGLFFFGIENLEKIEQHELEKDSLAAENYLYYKISSVNQLNRDWSYWDSSYYFMDDMDSYYIEENLPESTFTNLELDAILYFDKKGEFFYGRYYDFEENKFTEIPGNFIKKVKESNYVKTPSFYSNRAGIIDADGDIYIVTINPLLKSNLDGPVNGVFVMAKKLSGDYFAGISKEINQKMEFLDLDSYEKLNLPSEFSEPLIVYSEGDDEISLISPVYSIEDEIAGYIKVTNERELFRLGFGSLLLNFIFAIITCIVVVIIISYFLESIITRRLEFFSYELEKIAENENYNVRLREEGDDEISSIIRSANILLDKIQGSVESLEEKNLELSRVLDKKSELIGELHHRVKNNLQYIISLLGIKSLRIKDEIALDVINEATNRIKYLGIIHDDLYNKEDKATLFLKENFESLAKLILDGLKQEKREKISIKISGDEIEAKLSNAILLSTAIYELLKNSVDHAFDETGGNIYISLKEDNKGVIIKVFDDGIGMQKQRCTGETGFGLRNARDIITKQLSGTLESTDIEKGTSWIITIKTEFIKGKQEN